MPPHCRRQAFQGEPRRCKQRLLRSVTVSGAHHPRPTIPLHDGKGNGEPLRFPQSDPDGIATSVELLGHPCDGSRSHDIAPGNFQKQPVAGTDDTHRRLTPAPEPRKTRNSLPEETPNHALRKNHQVFHGPPHEWECTPKENACARRSVRTTARRRRWISRETRSDRMGTGRRNKRRDALTASVRSGSSRPPQDVHQNPRCEPRSENAPARKGARQCVHR